MTIPFIDLKAQQERIRPQINAAIGRVLDHGAFIMGPEVPKLEQALAEFCGAIHAVSCANGTDALTLALMAEEIEEGDIVFVPAFTFVATAEAPAQLGATPYFVDVVEDTFNIDPHSLEQGIADARRRGMKPKGVIAVDLFGLPADYDALGLICNREGLLLIADGAQSFGARYHEQSVGTLADYTTTSFFPAKPLGCYGDGGAVFTEDPARADRLKSLRVHGKGTTKYHNVRVGLNSRLDTIQAAILLEKLSIFSDELQARQQVAETYTAALKDKFNCPDLPNDCTSSWAQYTLLCDDRSKVKEGLAGQNIPCMVYYPVPLHQQPGYTGFPKAADLTVSERLSQQVISLPMSPYMKSDVQDLIINQMLSL